MGKVELKIKKPDWAFEALPRIFSDEVTITIAAKLNDWFNENVEPVNKILRNAIAVTTANAYDWNVESAINATHKALLINIEPIKKESAKDVLEALLRIVPRAHSEYSAVVRRAKKVLDEN